MGLTSGILALYFATQNPLVIVLDGEKKIYREGKRKPQKITHDDIREVAEEFIKLRYRWKKFTPKLMLKSISPLTTEGFRIELNKLFGKSLSTKEKKTKIVKERTLEQEICNLEIIITKKEILAKFYKILTIDGIPLPVIPTQIKLSMLKGNVTKWNPRGLYVNGVIEHNAK